MSHHVADHWAHVIHEYSRSRRRLTLAGAHRKFPLTSGIMFWLGFGGLFDGIALHQLLQWHHVASARRPPETLADLQFNVALDGLFHLAALGFVLIALVLLWRTGRRRQVWWSGRMLSGAILMGFGIFNLAEGLISHHLLGLHHVNETVPAGQQVFWDIGFLLWGAAMLVLGRRLYRRGRLVP